MKPRLARVLHFVTVATAMSLISVSPAKSTVDDGSKLTVRQRLLDKRTLVIAHRGCWRQPAENSIEGLRKCAEIGVDFVEIDLRETADGVVVLLHDDTLDRTTTMRGRLRDHRYADVRNARLRRDQGGPASPLTDQVLPTLEDVFRAQLDTFIFLDIKEPIHEDVYQLVQKYNAQDRVLISINRQFGDQVLQSSFARTVAVMPKLDQYENETCIPKADPVASVAGYASLKAYIYEAVFCDDDYLAHAVSATRGSKLWVNTLGPRFAAGRTEEEALRSPDKVWGQLLNRGVGAVQTDHPLELLLYLERSGRR